MIKEVENIYDLTGSDNYKRLFRINYNGLRLYVQSEPFQFYSGLTGAQSACTFNGNGDKKRLKNWREDFIDSFGKKNADAYLNMTADFGTLLHEALVRIKNNGAIDWNEEKEISEEYFHGLFLQAGNVDLSLIKRTSYEYQKQVASLMQFVYERVQVIHAIEVPVIWEELRIATPVDMVCDCRQTPQGDFKTTTINIKTSSQISRSHMEQIAAELTMWNQTYGTKAEYTAILRTKDWNEEKQPTYEYKYMDVVEAMDISGRLYQRLNLCLNDPDSTYLPSPRNKAFSGVSKVGEKPNIVIKELGEEWVDYWREKELEHVE